MLNFSQGKDDSRIKYKGRSPYVSKNYKNPFFEQRRRRLTGIYNVSRRFKLAIYAGLALGVALAAVFLYSGLFSIKIFDINGQGRINRDDIKGLAEARLGGFSYLILPNKNILAYDGERLAQELNARYGFEFLNIKRAWPNRMFISYQEKPYSFIVQEGDGYYYIAGTGLILAEANILEVQQRDYPIIKMETEGAKNGNAYNFNENFLKATAEIFYLFKAHDDLPIERFLYEGKIKTVTVKILNGPKLFFSSEEGIEDQINKIVFFKNEKLGPDFFKKEYLDVRNGTNVYIK